MNEPEKRYGKGDKFKEPVAILEYNEDIHIYL